MSSLSPEDEPQKWDPTHVLVTVLRGRGLRGKGKHGTSDVYTIIQLGKEKYSTCVVEKTTEPEWREECSFELQPGLLQQEPPAPAAGTELLLTVMHRAVIGMDVFLGQAVVPLGRVFRESRSLRNEWYRLNSKTGKKEKERGEIQVSVQFTRNHLTASMYDLVQKDLVLKDQTFSTFTKLKERMRGKRRSSTEDPASAAGLPGGQGSLVRTRTRLPSDGGGEEDYEDDEGGEARRSKMRTFFLRGGKLRKSSDTRSSTSLGSESSESSSRGGSLSPTAGISVVVSDLSNSPSNSSNLTADNSPDHTANTSPGSYRCDFGQEPGDITIAAPPPSLCVNGVQSKHQGPGPGPGPGSGAPAPDSLDLDLSLFPKPVPLSMSLQNLAPPRTTTDPHVGLGSASDGRRWSFDKPGDEEKAAIAAALEQSGPMRAEEEEEAELISLRSESESLGKRPKSRGESAPGGSEEKHKGWFGSKESQSKPSPMASPDLDFSSDPFPPLFPMTTNSSPPGSPVGFSSLGSPLDHINPFSQSQSPPPPPVSPSNPFFPVFLENPFLEDIRTPLPPPLPFLSSARPPISQLFPQSPKDPLNPENAGIPGTESQAPPLDQTWSNPFTLAGARAVDSEWDEGFDVFAAGRLQSPEEPPAGLSAGHHPLETSLPNTDQFFSDTPETTGQVTHTKLNHFDSFAQFVEKVPGGIRSEADTPTLSISTDPTKLDTNHSIKTTNPNVQGVTGQVLSPVQLNSSSPDPGSSGLGSSAEDDILSCVSLYSDKFSAWSSSEETETQNSRPSEPEDDISDGSNEDSDETIVSPREFLELIPQELMDPGTEHIEKLQFSKVVYPDLLPNLQPQTETVPSLSTGDHGERDVDALNAKDVRFGLNVLASPDQDLSAPVPSVNIFTSSPDTSPWDSGSAGLRGQEVGRCSPVPFGGVGGISPEQDFDSLLLHSRVSDQSSSSSSFIQSLYVSVDSQNYQTCDSIMSSSISDPNQHSANSTLCGEPSDVQTTTVGQQDSTSASVQDDCETGEKTEVLQAGLQAVRTTVTETLGLQDPSDLNQIGAFEESSRKTVDKMEANLSGLQVLPTSFADSDILMTTDESADPSDNQNPTEEHSYKANDKMGTLETNFSSANTSGLDVLPTSDVQMPTLGSQDSTAASVSSNPSQTGYFGETYDKTAFLEVNLSGLGDPQASFASSSVASMLTNNQINQIKEHEVPPTSSADSDMQDLKDSTATPNLSNPGQTDRFEGYFGETDYRTTTLESNLSGLKDLQASFTDLSVASIPSNNPNQTAGNPGEDSEVLPTSLADSDNQITTSDLEDSTASYQSSNNPLTKADDERETPEAEFPVRQVLPTPFSDSNIQITSSATDLTDASNLFIDHNHTEEPSFKAEDKMPTSETKSIGLDVLPSTFENSGIHMTPVDLQDSSSALKSSNLNQTNRFLGYFGEVDKTESPDAGLQALPTSVTDSLGLQVSTAGFNNPLKAEEPSLEDNGMTGTFEANFPASFTSSDKQKMMNSIPVSKSTNNPLQTETFEGYFSKSDDNMASFEPSFSLANTPGLEVLPTSSAESDIQISARGLKDSPSTSQSFNLNQTDRFEGYFSEAHKSETLEVALQVLPTSVTDSLGLQESIAGFNNPLKAEEPSLEAKGMTGTFEANFSGLQVLPASFTNSDTQKMMTWESQDSTAVSKSTNNPLQTETFEGYFSKADDNMALFETSFSLANTPGLEVLPTSSAESDIQISARGLKDPSTTPQSSNLNQTDRFEGYFSEAHKSETLEVALQVLPTSVTDSLGLQESIAGFNNPLKAEEPSLEAKGMTGTFEANFSGLQVLPASFTNSDTQKMMTWESQDSTAVSKSTNNPLQTETFEGYFSKADDNMALFETSFSLANTPGLEVLPTSSAESDIQISARGLKDPSTTPQSSNLNQTDRFEGYFSEGHKSETLEAAIQVLPTSVTGSLGLQESTAVFNNPLQAKEPSLEANDMIGAFEANVSSLQVLPASFTNSDKTDIQKMTWESQDSTAVSKSTNNPLQTDRFEGYFSEANKSETREAALQVLPTSPTDSGTNFALVNTTGQFLPTSLVDADAQKTTWGLQDFTAPSTTSDLNQAYGFEGYFSKVDDKFPPFETNFFTGKDGPDVFSTPFPDSDVQKTTWGLEDPFQPSNLPQTDAFKGSSWEDDDKTAAFESNFFWDPHAFPASFTDFERHFNPNDPCEGGSENQLHVTGNESSKSPQAQSATLHRSQSAGTLTQGLDEFFLPSCGRDPGPKQEFSSAPASPPGLLLLTSSSSPSLTPASSFFSFPRTSYDSPWSTPDEEMKETRHPGQEPAQLNSPHPVKPLTSERAEGRSVLEKLKSSISPGRGGHQSAEQDGDKKKSLTEGAGSYYHLTHSELVSLLVRREAELHRQRAEFERQRVVLSKREAELKRLKPQIRDLEDYIDTLLVRIMEQKPTLLQVGSRVK